MRIKAHIKGLDSILAKFPARRVRVLRAFSLGLKMGGLHIQRVSQQQVPVEFGVMKAGAFTRAVGNGIKTHVTVGYVADYAPYVHELVGMVLKGLPREPNPPHKGRYWDPAGRGKAKFLEDPFKTERRAVQLIVRNQVIVALHKP